MTGHLVVLLHLCDSLFPLGAFAHSDGLEAATSEGRIETADDLRGWLEATLTDTLGRLEGPAVRAAWHAFETGNAGALEETDRELAALRPSSTGREASRAMGGRLLTTWQQIRPHDGVGRLLVAHARLTLPVAFGVVAAASGIPARAAVEGFMYTRLAAVVSAAMRLMPLGQRAGHGLLADALGRVPALADGILTGTAPARSFAPAMDVAAMSQQYGRSRLFRS